MTPVESCLDCQILLRRLNWTSSDSLIRSYVFYVLLWDINIAKLDRLQAEKRGLNGGKYSPKSLCINELCSVRSITDGQERVRMVEVPAQAQKKTLKFRWFRSIYLLI
jgi:hypothetical protein